MAECISCAKNEGDPRNGGLCSSCAPPLSHPKWDKSRSGRPFGQKAEKTSERRPSSDRGIVGGETL